MNIHGKNILVIGSGGREHAIAHKFHKSDLVNKIFVAPGNPGMEQITEIVQLPDDKAIVDFAAEKNIDFVFIGPEQPLSRGLSDVLTNNGIKVIGPSRKAARIETSKVYAKNLMKKLDVPTAEYQAFDDVENAKNYLKKCKYPKVLKADGLAAGKGVIIVGDSNEAIDALNTIMINKKFGSAGKSLVIEDFLEGWETSIFAFTDGENFKTTIFSQDHKKLLEGDNGPNTGGMGAYAPVKTAEKYRKEVEEKIVSPILEEMKNKGVPYKGILYIGLIITKEGPKVLEFNCRLGDPETEVILPLLKTDLVEICDKISENKINSLELEWENKYCVTVVGASGGYPEKYEKGKTIKIEDEFPLYEDSCLYFAGVRKEKDEMITNGGRVFMITAKDSDLPKAISKAYDEMEFINFEKKYFRKDIGFRKK